MPTVKDKIEAFGGTTKTSQTRAYYAWRTVREVAAVMVAVYPANHAANTAQGVMGKLVAVRNIDEEALRRIVRGVAERVQPGESIREAALRALQGEP